jgi:predicted nucleic acid-binding protein
MILNFKGQIYCPIIMFIEIFRYKDLIIQKSNLDSVEIENLIHLLFNKIKFIDNQFLLEHRLLANEICQYIDIDDEMFFACAIYCNCPIWSNDKALKSQSKIKIYSSEEMLRLFEWTF